MEFYIYIYIYIYECMSKKENVCVHERVDVCMWGK